MSSEHPARPRPRIEEPGVGPRTERRFCRGRKVLLTGYDYFAAIREHGIPFRIRLKDLATRAQARTFIIDWQLSRPNLSRLQVNWLLGLMYHDEKQPVGGDRRSEAARVAAGGRGKTADALAERHCEGVSAIRRVAQLATAMNTLAQRCGADVTPLLISPTARLSRRTLVHLAGADDATLKQALGWLRVKGKLPRDWRRQLTGAEPETITLPAAHRPMVEAMLRRRGPDWLRQHAQAVQQILNQETESIHAKETRP